MHRPHATAVAGTGFVGLVVLGTALPLLRGGVDWPVQLGAAAVAGAAFLLAVGYRRSGTTLFIVGLAVVTGAVALQLLPLPYAVDRIVSPGAAGLFDTALRPLGLYPAARPLSLDPPATGRELAKAVTCLLSAAAAAYYAASRRRRDWLFASLALVGVGMTAAALTAALGGVAPLVEPKLFFVNRNHLAGFLNLTVFIALGFALRSHGRARVLWFTGFVVAGLGILLSLSRGGIAAFFFGASVFAVLHARRTRLERGATRDWRLAAIPVALCVVLAIGAYVAIDPLVKALSSVKRVDHDLKLALWPAGLALVRRFPAIGIGRGAFETAFAAYKTEPDTVTFTHLENEWLQVLIDVGLPMGLLLIGLVAFTWFAAARSRDLSRPEIGALAGVAALAIHNTVDFSLEILGVAVPFALILGLLSRHQRSWKLSPVQARVGAGIALALAGGGMAFYLAHPTKADAVRVSQARRADDAVHLAREAARWHPADYFPQAMAGVRLVQEGRCAEGLPWLSRAMVLDPTAPEPHRFAARCLAAGGKNTLAKREYRLALLMGEWDALPDALRQYGNLADLLDIVPDAPDWLGSLGSLLEREHPADAERVFRRAWTQYGDLQSLGRLAHALISLRRAEEALPLARKLEQLDPHNAAGFLAATRALSALGRGEEAHRELLAGSLRIPGSAAILVPLAQEALADRHYADAYRLAESIMAQAPADMARKRMFVATVLKAEGRLGEAIHEAESARDALPDEPGPYLLLAGTCADAGRYDDGIAAVEAAAALPSSRPGEYADELAQLRKARQAHIDRLRQIQLLDLGERPRSSP